jgi:HAD superfamily hydrolase (TIGR01509 family)
MGKDGVMGGMTLNGNGPHLVIFDCDGVLVDSEGPANRVLAEFLGIYGCRLTGAECEARFRGKTMAAVAAELAAEGIILPADWLTLLKPRALAALEAEIRPIPHAAEAVRAVEGMGLLSCVASQSGVDYLHFVLDRTGLLEHFRGRLFSSHMVARGKPFPDLFLHAAMQMKTGFDRCVVIEDSVTGVRAAVAAGMRCLALCTPGEAPHMAALGAEPIMSLMDVPTALL